MEDWLKRKVSKRRVSPRFAEAVQCVIDAGLMPDSPARAVLRQQMRAVESALFERSLANHEDYLDLLAQSYREGELRTLSDQYWALWRADADTWDVRFGVDFQAEFNKHLAETHKLLDSVKAKMERFGIWKEG